MPARDIALVLLICVAWAFNFLTSALAMREIPPYLFTALRFALLALPLLIASGRCAVRTSEKPKQFLPAMRHMVSCYVVAVAFLTGGILLHAWY